MTYIPTLATIGGIQHAAHPPRLVRPGQHAVPLSYAAQLDHEADDALAHGQGDVADRSAHLTLEHRARANGSPA